MGNISEASAHNKKREKTFIVMSFIYNIPLCLVSGDLSSYYTTHDGCIQSKRVNMVVQQTLPKSDVEWLQLSGTTSCRLYRLVLGLFGELPKKARKKEQSVFCWPSCQIKSSCAQLSVDNVVYLSKACLVRLPYTQPVLCQLSDIGFQFSYRLFGHIFTPIGSNIGHRSKLMDGPRILIQFLSK